MKGRPGREPGQTMAAGVAAVVIVLLSAALACDLGTAELARTRQADELAAAEEACMAPAVAVTVKNSGEPGRAMCEALVAKLRAAGFDGEVDAYYYEPDQATSGLGEDRRAIAFGATLTSETPTVFAKLAGVDLPPVKTLSWAHLCTYAAQRTWRPSAASNGTLHVAAGERSGTWRPVAGLDEAAMPGVTAEVAQAVEEAKAR